MGERGERSRVEDVINGEVVERKTSNWGGGGNAALIALDLGDLIILPPPFFLFFLFRTIDSTG